MKNLLAFLLLTFTVAMASQKQGQIYCGRRLASVLAYICDSNFNKRSQERSIGTLQDHLSKERIVGTQSQDHIFEQRISGPQSQDYIFQQLNTGPQSQDHIFQQLNTGLQSQDHIFQQRITRPQSQDHIFQQQITGPQSQENMFSLRLPWIGSYGPISFERTRNKRQVVSECCDKPCTVDELLSYCGN